MKNRLSLGKEKAKDAAGNETVVEKTVTVNAPQAPTPQPGGGGAGDPTPTPTPTPTPEPTPQPEPTPTPEPTPQPEPTPGPGPGVDRSLTLLVPKRVRLAKKRRPLVIGVTTKAAGRLSISLVRNKRARAAKTWSVKAGKNKAKLRIPRKLRAGRYVLKVSFIPAGETSPVTARATVKFVR